MRRITARERPKQSGRARGNSHLSSGAEGAKEKGDGRAGATPNEITLPGKKTVTARPTEMRTYRRGPRAAGRRPQSRRAAGNGAGQRHAGGKAKIKPRRAVSLEEFRACRGILHGPDFGKKI